MSIVSTTIDSVVCAGAVLFIGQGDKKKLYEELRTTQYLFTSFQNICTYVTRRPCDEKRKYRYFETK